MRGRRWLHRCCPCRALATVVLGVPFAGRAVAGLVINELLPDPAGSDAGHEFVEFLNNGLQGIVMEGVEFQFANGADGPDWRTRWTGVPGTVLGPGERFLLVDRNWTGMRPGDAEAALGLQNGPDAVRLVRGDSILDLVGYGPLTDPALREGTAAAIEPGLSLARRPDGHDSGDNARDFVAAVPTPGEMNFRPWSMAIEACDLEPPSLALPGQALTVQALLRNDGLEAWPPTEIRAEAGGDLAGVQLGTWLPDETRSITWILRPQAEGAFPVVFAASPEGAPQTVAGVLGRVQVGPGDLVFNEVLAAPTQDQGEWFELLAAGDAAVDLADYEVRDEDGEWRGLPALELAPGELGVVAQDSTALRDWIAAVSRRGGWPDCPGPPGAVPIVVPGSWPTLNNTAGADRVFADRLRLRIRQGMTIDHVVLGAAGGPDVPGRSMERSALRPTHPTGAPWAVCTAAPGSTPGCRNSTALTGGEIASALALVPAVLDAAFGAGAVHAVFVLSASEARWRLRVYDLWGVPVRDFGGDDLGAGPRDLLWDGRDDAGSAVPAGGYVFALEVWSGTRRPIRSERRLCAVRR